MAKSVISRLTQDAVSIRQRLDDAQLPDLMAGFPVACCGTVSEVLSVILKQRYKRVVYICGEQKKSSGGGRSHAWVQVGDIVVDITADQFDGMSPVTVTRDSSWHKGWEIRTRRPACDLEQASSQENGPWWALFGAPLYKIMTGSDEAPPMPSKSEDTKAKEQEWLRQFGNEKPQQ
jgi:hypothetical protein